MIPKAPKNTRKSSKNPGLQALTPLDKAAILVLVEKNIHRNPYKISQQAIGSGCAKHRHNKKKSSRPYINTRIKNITDLGVIKHWGEYEDMHWYQVTPEYRDLFFKIEALAKRIIFEAVSALHSQAIDCIENLTLLLTNLLTVLIKKAKVPHKGKSPKRSSSYNRYFDSYFPQKFPDATAYQLICYAKQIDLLMETYGVPFKPEIDYGKEVNACLFEIECFEFEMEWY